MADALTNTVVSIHASTREATTTAKGVLRVMQFQSTPPRGRRRGPAPGAGPALPFQSTPPRGRRPARMRLCPATVAVSIHASTREATGCQPDRDILT